MRFAELALERYGDYEKLTVPINGPGLNVIYGPNEAGKSTCLSAITDFLFGIPNNSSYGQVFGYGLMRIRATLELPDGQRFDLRRRKGHERTLSDGNGKVVDESIVQRVLPGMSRERFSTLFGLGHEALREGGRHLLEAEGDIGRLIVEAAGGLRTLVDRIGELREEADELFATRRSERRRFYQLYDRFAEATKEIREGTLTYEAYRKSEDNLAQTVAKHRGLTEDRLALETRKSARERASRVLPLLAQLDLIELEIETYGDVALLRPDFVTDVQETLKARDQANELLQEATNRCADLQRQIDKLPNHELLLGCEPEVRTIGEKATNVRAERESRPNRERELAVEQAKLVRLRELLQLDADADLRTHVPTGDARETARQLATQGRSLAEQVEGTEKQIRGYEREVVSLDDKLTVLKEKGFDRALTIQVPEGSTLLRLQREAKVRNRDAGKLEDKFTHCLTTWGFSSVEELRDFRCPDPDRVKREIDRRKTLKQEIEAQSEGFRQAKDRLSAAQKAIERLQTAGEVPTDAAIDHARSARKSAWEPIRSAYLSDDPETLSAIPRPERESNAIRLEDRTEEVDRLSDRKSTEAQRIADLATAKRDEDEAKIALESAESKRKELEEILTDEARGFVETWRPAVEKAADLPMLRQLAEDREAALEEAAEASRLRAEARDRQAEADDTIARLSRAESDLGLSPEPEVAVDQRIHTLEQASNAYEEAHKEWLQNHAKREQIGNQLARAKAEVSEMKQVFAAWRGRWEEVMPKVGLPPNSTIESAEQILKEWSEAQTALVAIEIAQRRLGQFDRDEDDLKKMAEGLFHRLDFRIPEDPIAAAEMLQEQLQDAKGIEAQRRTLQTQKDGAEEDRRRKQNTADRLTATVRGLCDEAKLADEQSLKETAARLRELLQRRQAHAQKLQEVHAAGDGKSVEDLRAECKGLDPDGLRAQLEEIRSDRERLDQEIQQAYAEIKSREADVQKFTAAAGINSAESRRQSAAAEMRAVIERYLEVTLAQELLEQAIDRLRQERQDPLIVSAGDLFKLATRGSYVGIGTNIDDRGPVVVGKRPTGEDVRVEEMSDGTRDQLFLAFRIASVEQYCKPSGPIPFIADDLLVHFDDDRSGAALELLAALGCHTQVLLFTHHRAVRDMAPAVLKRGTFAITELAS